MFNLILFTIKCKISCYFLGEEKILLKLLCYCLGKAKILLKLLYYFQKYY